MEKALIENTTFSSAISEAHNYNKWVLDIFTPYLGKSVLEVGIGHGGFQNLVKACTNIDQYSGVDIDPNLVEHAKNHYPENNYYCADICDKSLIEKIPHRFDSIICFNVIEHIEDDNSAIENMLKLLNPKGHLLVFTPAFQSLYSDMDTIAGHFRRYTKSTLVNAVPKDKRDGIIKVNYFNPIGGIGWYLNKFKKYDTLEDETINKQILFFDRYILPVSKVMDRVTKPFFGQSIYGVIQNV